MMVHSEHDILPYTSTISVGSNKVAYKANTEILGLNKILCSVSMLVARNALNYILYLIGRLYDAKSNY